MFDRHCFRKCMLFLLVTFVAQLSSQGVPILRPKFDQRFKIKSGSVAHSSATQFQLILSMQPANKRTIQLCSRNQNLFLQVNSNGIVNGTHERNNKYSLLVQESMAMSVIRLKGLATNRYIAMNKKGKVYSTALPTEESLFFTNQEENYYHTFWSYLYKTRSSIWLLSLKRNGKIKRGSRTRVGEKSTQFFVVLYDDSRL